MKIVGLNLKKYIYGGILLFAMCGVTSCSDAYDMPELKGNEPGTLSGRFARYMVDGQPVSLDGEDRVDEMKACVFNEGKLVSVYESVPVVDGQFKLTVKENTGMLYLVANAVEAGVWQDMNVGNLTEDEWTKRTVKLKNGKPVSYFTGSLKLETPVGSEAKQVLLTRGVARFDVAMNNSEGVMLKSVRLENVASDAYFLPQSSVISPATEFTTMEEHFAEPLSVNKAGIMYVYEQSSDGMKVVLDVAVDGVDKKYETSIPAGGIKRNAVYTLDLNRNAVKVKVDEWNLEGDISMAPDFTGRITIDSSLSVLPGAQISDDGNGLDLSYLSTEIELRVISDNDLEGIYTGDDVLSVEPLKREDGTIERNAFRIVKRLSPIGYVARPSVLRFKRKGLTEVYDDDYINLNLEANPTKVSGLLQFGLDGMCDFAKYVDNGLGEFEVQEGKELVVDLEGEDPWLKAELDETRPNVYHIIAGWKPNDPKGDGREQAAKIIIRDKSEVVSKNVAETNAEVYTVKRRNWAIPVVKIGERWFSKYNLRRNARKYEDQILVGTDPAVKAGKSLFEYLNTCSSEEYMEVIGSNYQSGSSNGLTLTYSDGKWHYPGFVTDNTVLMSRVDKKNMAPDGFELPDKEAFRSLVWGYDCALGNKASDGFGDRPRGNLKFAGREDISQNGGTLRVHHHMVYFTESRYSQTRVSDEFVWYGSGYQGAADGAATELYVFYATSSTENGLWTLRCNNVNTFKFENYGADSENKTHVIRCVKSPVEYQY